MCQGRWVIHVVIKRKLFYINICSFSTVFYHISVSDAHKAEEKTCARVFV